MFLFCRKNKFFLFWVSSRCVCIKGPWKFSRIFYINVSQRKKVGTSFVMLVFELQEIFIWRASDSLDCVEMDSYSGWQGIFF